MVNTQQTASSSSALVNTAQTSSSTQQQAMFQSFSTVPAAALFDSFQIVHNPYSQYVVPTMYSVSDQQRIRNWDTAINYSFIGNGARYMQTLSLHTVLSRPMQVNDNIVFLFCPTIQFTPDTPFDTIDKVTHVWYKVVDVQNDMVFFDKHGLLLNMVSSEHIFVAEYLLWEHICNLPHRELWACRCRLIEHQQLMIPLGQPLKEPSRLPLDITVSTD